MKNKLLITIWALFYIVPGLKAQVAPSPDAMGAINLTQSEDLYRGYVSEIVPLYEVAAENGYKVPIQLVYQTRGIKVSDVSSSVGLGWNLAAGGAITRVMKDEPDDQSIFVNKPDVLRFAESEISHEKGNDFQKDIFYINLPGGGGSFINIGPSMQSSGTTSFYGLPYNDFKIAFTYTSASNSYWEVTDTQGIKYTFGKTAEGRETTRSWSYEEGQAIKANEDFTYISTWYLEKIEFPNLPEASNITFTYAKNPTKLRTKEKSTTKEYPLVNSQVLYHYSRKDGDKIGIYDYFEINKLYPTTGTCCYPAQVVLPGNVQDYRPTYTTIPGLYDYEKYFEDCNIDADPYTDCDGTQHPTLIENLVNPPEDDYNRVPYQMVTAGAANGGTTSYAETEIHLSKLIEVKSLKAKATLVYGSRIDSDAMSKLETVSISNNLNGGVVTTYDLDHNYFGEDGLTPGCPSDKDCKRLKLISVTQNGYNYRSFSYINELNSSLDLPPKASIKRDKYGYYRSDVTDRHARYSFRWFVDSQLPVYNAIQNFLSVGPEGNNRDASGDARANILWKVNYPTGGYKEFTYSSKSSGGVKIDAVQLKDGSEVIAHKTYTYTDERKMDASLHAIGGNKVTLFSDSPYLTFDHAHLGGYRHVEVKDEKSGIKTIYDFYFSPVNDKSDKSKWTISSNTVTIEDQPEGTAPLMSPPFSPYVGLPQTITVKDANDQPISVSTMEYKYGATEATVKDQAFVESGTPNVYYVGSSPILLRPFYMDYTENSSFENGEENKTKTTVSYHPTYKSLVNESLTETIIGENINTKTLTFYPSDYSHYNAIYTGSSTVLNEMVTNNMVGVPVMTETQINLPEYGAGTYKTSAANLTTFQKSSNLYFPHQTYQLTLQEPSGIWGENEMRLLGSATYNAQGLVSNQMDEIAKIQTINNYNAQGYLTSQVVDPGVTSMQRTTAYTYEPLVGVKTITDANGRVTTYEYDDRNRLHLIRDQDGNIVERYRYNIGDEVTTMSAGINVNYNATHGNKEDFAHSFSATDISCPYEECTYAWDWGDGTTSGSVTSTTHTYSDPGTYTVTLTMLNPEVGIPFNTSTNVTISDIVLDADIQVNYNAGGSYQDLSHNFNLTNIYCPYGGCTYSWDWGDGTTSGNSTSHNHTYSSPSNYMVRVTISKPEFNESTTVTKLVGIDPALLVTPNSWTFGETAANRTISVSTNQSSYSVSDNRSWITTSYQTATSFRINVTSTDVDRSGTVTVTAGPYTKTVAVSQEVDAVIIIPCGIGCTWDPIDQRCEDEFGNAGVCTQ